MAAVVVIVGGGSGSGGGGGDSDCRPPLDRASPARIMCSPESLSEEGDM